MRLELKPWQTGGIAVNAPVAAGPVNVDIPTEHAAASWALPGILARRHMVSPAPRAHSSRSPSFREIACFL